VVAATIDEMSWLHSKQAAPKLNERQCEQVKDVVGRLVNWKGWQAPKDDEIDRVLSDSKFEVKDWFKSRGLSTGYLMGAPE